MESPTTARIGIDAFHRERSRCVDAFATAERAVNNTLDATRSKRGGEPLKQRIANLRKVQPMSGYSNTRKLTVDVALNELETRLPLRADIVHGCLELVEFPEDNRACFANARQEVGPGIQMRTFTLSELREVTLKVSEIATRLRV